MLSSINTTNFLLLLFVTIVLSNLQVRSDDEDDLLQGINKYRASQNLTTLTKNENAACLAEEIAEQYKNQPCTNSTGANTVPGTENQFPNYPELLAHCNLNISNTRDGMIMPACVPNLEPGLVLTNFTKSQYSGSLNESTYTGAGIGSDGNWIVVVLTTNSSTGSYETYKGSGFVSRPSHLYYLIAFLMGCLFLL
ncbi:unnamed protein product [Amaranthus hypochondriacus]